MDMYEADTKYELQLKTNMKQCEYVGSGRFEFDLYYVEMKNEHKFEISFKNLEVPRMRKKLKFEAYIGKFYENFSKEKMMKSFVVTYENHQELAETLEIILNQNFILNANICLNFYSRHSNHECDSSDIFKNAQKISLTFKNDRFFLYLGSNVVVYMSPNFAQCLGLQNELDGRTSAEIGGGYVRLFRPCYVSSQKVPFLSDKDTRVNVVLHDSISQYVRVCNGEIWPIMYSGSVNGNHVGEKDKLLCMKKMTTKCNHRFCVGFYNGNMEPFRCSHEEVISSNPFSFTLVFIRR